VQFERLETAEQMQRAEEFYRLMNGRRTIRDYSDQGVPLELIEKAIATAGTAPSGANMQPWRFVVVKDVELKRRIREAAEREEHESYQKRMSAKWLRRLAVLGTDEHKPFLEIAPYLIVVFRITNVVEDGETEPTYYSQESVGIAVGLLLAALHNVGLATLTHTPSPMKCLQEILGRPRNEVPFVLIPVGFPAEDAKVPDIMRKPLDEIMQVR
jgi:iodotyrosine deiodinase